MNITIEQTTDFKELARMNEVVHTWHHQNYPAEFKAYNYAEIAKAFEKLLSNQDFFAFLAKSDEKTIGYLLAYLKKRPDSAFQYPKTILYIDQIAVIDSHKKQGVGKLLLEKIYEIAKKNEVSEIQLDYWSGNELAENFFSNTGFVYFNHRMKK